MQYLVSCNSHIFKFKWKIFPIPNIYPFRQKVVNGGQGHGSWIASDPPPRLLPYGQPRTLILQGRGTWCHGAGSFAVAGAQWTDSVLPGLGDAQRWLSSSEGAGQRVFTCGYLECTGPLSSTFTVPHYLQLLDQSLRTGQCTSHLFWVIPFYFFRRPPWKALTWPHFRVNRTWPTVNPLELFKDLLPWEPPFGTIVWSPASSPLLCPLRSWPVRSQEW